MEKTYSEAYHKQPVAICMSHADWTSLINAVFDGADMQEQRGYAATARATRSAWEKFRDAVEAASYIKED